MFSAYTYQLPEPLIYKGPKREECSPGSSPDNNNEQLLEGSMARRVPGK